MLPPSLRRAMQTFPVAPGLVLRTLLGRALRRLAPRALDTALGPAIGTRTTFETDERALVATLLPDVTAARIEALAAEYAAIHDELSTRAGQRDLPMPAAWRTGQATGFVLYALTRELRPAVVLETGIANGWSSLVFLRALGRTGSGALHSVDVRTDTGGLVDDADADGRWTRHVVRPTDGPRALDRIADGLPPIDLFFHDSDHSYLHMRLELRAAGRHLAPQGVLCSDDVGASHAYVEACEALGLAPHVLVDGHKASGFARG